MNNFEYLDAMKELIEKFKARISAEYETVLIQTLSLEKKIPQKIQSESDSVIALAHCSQELVELCSKHKKVELVLKELHEVSHLFLGIDGDEKTAKAKFRELKIKEEFKEIMIEIAYDAWRYERERNDVQEKFYNGLENGLDYKYNSLLSSLEQGVISKKDFIIYDILCSYLIDIQDFQDYIGLSSKTK